MIEIDISKLTRDYRNFPLGKIEVPAREDLEYLFIEQGMTVAELTKYFNKGKSSVARWLQKYDIKKGTPQTKYVDLAEDINEVDVSRLSRDFQKQPWKPHVDTPVKSDFEYLYLELNWSAEAVATYMGLSIDRVQKIANGFNLYKTKEQHSEARSREVMRKYGVPHISKLPEVQSKKEETTMKNHGVKSVLCSREYRHKNTFEEQELVSLPQSEYKKDTYLTEDKLVQYLEIIYPGVKWERDKVFPGQRFRPDYINHDLKIVVEFDGGQHYSSVNFILRDNAKDDYLKEHDYTVIRIPYFVQMSKEVIKLLFGKDVEVEQVYRHGFIADKGTMLLPADFNELGIERFEKDLEKFSIIKDEIVQSLKEKVDRIGIVRVLPKSLRYLVD